jgi:hypothetical protein
MNDLIFITEPRSFTNVDNTTFIINGISGKINNSYEIIIGSDEQIQFELKFWTYVDNTYIEKSIITVPLKKEYDIPNIGLVPIISGFFSPDKEVIYNMAKIISLHFGYTLVPFLEQSFLNKNN